MNPLEPAELLAAYDAQLRTDAETPGARSVTRLGALRLVEFGSGRGFITYRELGVASAAEVAELVEAALAHFTANDAITKVEWKTRGHDHAPGLHDALVANGFVAQEPESIMIGEAALLAVDVEPSAGVTIRKVTDEAGVTAACAMQDEVFGGDGGEDIADGVLKRIAKDDGLEMWVAEAEGEVVCAGRVEPVANTDFAGIWGGATMPQWRGRGIYRALTSARAKSALASGKSLINSDSTEFSRPILERSGLVKVSTTTPYEWRR
ncbi:ribosomal protein S18 acetylase RimI-like enzyme [Nocardioides daedukensis]|uniref:Ribosomal protein S18 acetylase RimI-like enzyme n=1 Tax=Nocardioides daedukensis TaxID=634462 RepID=A0A7Y9UUA6_9ACTN|nr:ribosomal protein S18 acetylase RimI-like enzyme [Nocardioides daedukensis]